MQPLAQDEIVQQYKKISTSAISDALDKHGIEGVCLGISPLDNSFRTVGRAYTIKYGPCGVEKGTVGDYIDDVPPGHVVVLDNGGRTDCTVWGDILTTAAKRAGIAGTVINGVCRDVSLAISDHYPIYSAGRTMRTGKDRVQVEGVNIPVTLGNIRVNVNDIIAADADGVVVIPQEIEAEILKTALQIEETEAVIREKVRQGMRVDEVRKEMNYHKLQRGSADEERKMNHEE